MRAGERSNVQLGFQRTYSLVASSERSDLHFDMPWVALESTRRMDLARQASWPRFDMHYRYRVFEGLPGQDLRAPLLDQGGHARRGLPRLGVSYTGPGRALHAAYIESLHAPAANTWPLCPWVPSHRPPVPDAGQPGAQERGTARLGI